MAIFLRVGRQRLTVGALGALVLGSLVMVPGGGAAAQTAPTVALPGAPRPPSGASTDKPDAPAAVKAVGTRATVPTGTWQPLGPAPIGPPYLAAGGFYGGVNSGRITGLTALPSGPHAGRVVAGTAGGGIWTSDDNGTTWTARSDQAPSLAIGSVTRDPANPEHLIAGTGEANQCGDCYAGFGVLSSTDGGTTWTNQNPGGVFTGKHIESVAIDPVNSSRMFAATDGGLFATTNGGVTWAKPADPSYVPVDGNVTAVVIDPTNAQTIFIGGGAATVAKSTDGGVHWTAANTGITLPSPATIPLTSLAIAASNHVVLYASVGTTNPVKLYRSTDGGTTWSPVAAAPDYTGQGFSYGSGTDEQGWYDNVVAVDPTNANHVIAGGIALVESIDGGATWSNVNGKTFFAGGTNKIHPDQHALAFRTDGKVWIGDDGGVFLYNPAGPTVTNSNGNLNVTQFYFGFNEVGGVVLAGSQDNASSRTSSPTVAAWTGIFGGDGGPAAITPNSTSVQFIEGNRDLFVTTDAFATTLHKITPPRFGLFTPPMIVVPNAGNPTSPTVFYGADPDLYRTTNPTAGSPTWTKVTSVGSAVSAIASSPSNPSVVYVGFENGTVQVSTDGGATFTSLAAQPFAATYVTGISVDPTNPAAITVSVSTSATPFFVNAPHVAQYSYSGAPATGTWSVITGNLPGSVGVRRVVYDNGALIAATDAGVYGTGAVAGGGTAWSIVGTGLPLVQTQDLFVDAGTGKVYALTHGRGAWVLAAAAPSGPTVCTSAHTGETFTGAVQVPPGARCDLTNSSVIGDINVGSNAALVATNTVVTGSVNATGGTVQLLGGTHVQGNVSIYQATAYAVAPGAFLIKAMVCGTTIDGKLSVQGAPGFGSIVIGGSGCAGFGTSNTIGATFIDTTNQATSHDVSDNHVGGVMTCSGNVPAPTGSGNTAVGGKFGQCAGL